MIPWTYPLDRYYYDWYSDPVGRRTDGDIKAEVVDRLDLNEHTRDHRLKVDVDQHVVVLGGRVDSALAKRAAGDDAWDPPAWSTSATRSSSSGRVARRRRTT